MTQALCTGPAGSAKWPKGAKGAIYFLCPLLHTSRSVHAQATLVRDSARGEKCASHGLIGDMRQNRVALDLCNCVPGVTNLTILAAFAAVAQTRTRPAPYIYGGVEGVLMAARLVARLDELEPVAQADWGVTAEPAPYRLTTDLICLVGGTA